MSFQLETKLVIRIEQTENTPALGPNAFFVAFLWHSYLDASQDISYSSPSKNRNRFIEISVCTTKRCKIQSILKKYSLNPGEHHTRQNRCVKKVKVISCLDSWFSEFFDFDRNFKKLIVCTTKSCKIQSVLKKYSFSPGEHHTCQNRCVKNI